MLIEILFHLKLTKKQRRLQHFILYVGMYNNRNEGEYLFKKQKSFIHFYCPYDYDIDIQKASDSSHLFAWPYNPLMRTKHLLFHKKHK